MSAWDVAMLTIVGILLGFVPASMLANEEAWMTSKGVDRQRETSDQEDRGEIEEIMTLLQSVSHQLTKVRAVIHNLKLHNQMIYKHLHKIHQDKCHSTSSKKDHHAWMSLASPTVYQNHEADVTKEEEDDEEEDDARSFASATTCPSGFHRNAETQKCYRVHAEKRVSWQVARDRCKFIGAELVSIQSSREQSYIVELLRKKHTDKCDYWTGLTSSRTKIHSLGVGGRGGGGGGRSGGGREQHKVNSVHWYWTGDGSSLGRYTNWNKNEPNDVLESSSGDSSGVCVQMLWIFNWKWNDASCSISMACFICQTRLPTLKSADIKKSYRRH